MHLRTLTLQAIGPFTGRHTVDFAELGASGLFLLEGPTGSGKSTLIDAVVFALYGTVASSQASDERLRSAGADPDTESFVDLVVEVPSGVFRIRRTPQYERSKLRGSGTTTQPATVKAWRLPADTPSGATPDDLAAYGDPIAARPDEVGAFVQDAIGLDRAQFVQTVVLPQGEFASFLRAKPEDRARLLQKIFGTQVYEALAARLVELRREANGAVETARGGLAEAASHFVGAARLTDDDAAALRSELEALALGARAAAALQAEPDPVATMATGAAAAVDDRVGALAQVAVEAAEAARAADEARATTRAALDEAVATGALLERRDRLRSERSALEASSAEATGRALALGRARAAATVRPLLDGAAAAATTLDAATKALIAALDRAPEGMLPAHVSVTALVGVDARGRTAGGRRTRDAGRRHLEAVRRDATAAAGRLERPVALEAQLEERRRDVHRQAEGIDDLRLELGLHETWLAARPEHRRVLAERRDAARALAARLGECQGTASVAGERLAAVDELAAVRERLTETDAEREVAAGVAQRAADDEHALRSARITGMAGVLAADLEPGRPCPVCGSAEHPAPAALAPDHVSGEDVDAAETARVAAVDRLHEVAERAGRLRGRVEALAALVGDLRHEAAEAELAAAERAVADCAAAAEQEGALAAELEGFDAATAEREARRQQAAAELAAAETALTTAKDELVHVEDEVTEARDGHPTVAARFGAVVERARVADELLVALADERSAADQVAARTAELDAGVAAAGFASPDEARDALLSAGRLDALEQEVAQRAADVARVTSGLAEPQLVALSDDLTVDLAAVAAAEQEARRRAEESAGLARLAAGVADAAATSGRGLVDRARELAEHLVAAAPVTRLANLAAGGGDNARGLTLGTFVLMRRFEDVVAAANERLLVMSDGRYSLVRSDEREDVRARCTGLAMRVVDHVTDQQRDPRTLSGGESFYVSLCLALGLADVVTAEAGGLDLGTLFVDEGFGSLDSHVLDQVLAELGRLRAGGRVVGVVSHVEALKQSIADRIEVRPRANGSSTLTVRAG